MVDLEIPSSLAMTCLEAPLSVRRRISCTSNVCIGVLPPPYWVDEKNPLCEQRVNSSYQLRLVAYLLSVYTLQDVHSEGDCRSLWLRLAFDPRRRKPTFQIWRPATIVRLEIAERSIESE